MSNVVELPVTTRLDTPVDRIIQRAQEENLEQVIVVGRSQDGTLYFASSIADGADVVWLMRHAEFELFKCANVIG